jgi:hypothetical protein
MQRNSVSKSGFFNPRICLAFMLCALGTWLAALSFASSPSSGTLTDTSGPVNYTAGPFNVANPTPLPEGVDAGPECSNPSQPCDDFALTISLPAGYKAAHPNVSAKVTLSWTDAGSGNSDYDLYIYKGTVINTNGTKAADHQSATSANPEIATIKPLADGSQTYTVKVVPFTPSGETVKVKIELVTGSDVPSPSPGLPGSGPGVPRFFNYQAPPGIANSVGEPSIGSNYKSEKTFSNSLFSIPNGGTALLFGGFSPSLARATFNDCSSPAGALWEAKPLLTANSARAFGDPILFTDHDTGRTFVSQLEGLTPAGSTTDITDNDGDSFTPSEGSSLPSDIDHQTIGGGPFAPPLTGGTPIYPKAVYYASQSVTDARCGRSDNGGLTFGPATVMFTTVDCGGLHGHIKVAPDGTVYVPNNACGGTAQPGHEDGNQAVIVSGDNGLTWSIRKIPGSTTKSNHDGSVAVASDSKTIYEGFQSGDGHPRIAVSHDKGVTWSAPFDVGTTVIGGGPILNTGFAAVVAGDPNRAAFAFYGTVTGGNDWNTPGFPGEWYLYVATTYDGGVTWTTQNLTPGDPIQRGGICGSGACRNHLDFFDATIDKEGRVVIGYTDGCITSTCINGGPNDYTAKGTIARQTGGKRMVAANDPNTVEPAIPGAPLVSGSINGSNTVAKLSWGTPDDGGSPLTAYKISRGPSATGPFTLLATLPAGKNNYGDNTFDPTIQNFYIVTAENAVGVGPFCGAFHPPVVTVVPENACTLPGLTILTDGSNDEIDTVPGHDVQSLRISEPVAFAPNKVVFTLKMQSLATVPPDTRWPVTFNVGSPAVNYTVRMTNSPADGATTVPIFQVGRTTTTTPPPAEPFVAADPASHFAPDGTITIVVPRTAIGNPAPGQAISGFLTRIAANLVGATITPDNMPDSLAPSGSYTIVGNAPCAPPNLPPTGILTGTPSSGGPPLVVNFTGAGSTDPDPGDSIASYTFDFGDGSAPVTKSSPTISHTYNAPGVYTAQLTVTDSHGLPNDNTALFVINVTAILQNISTRAQVLTGDNVLIGGFIVTGIQPKKVIVRAIGPSVKANGQPVPGAMQDTTLELHDKNTVIATNDDWKNNDENHQSQQAEIEATGIPPTDDRESALVRTLNPGNYTVVLRGINNSTGIAVVEAYDLSSTAPAQLANISSRGLVQTGNNVMIGGFIVGPAKAADTRVVIRGIGPSLSGSNVPNPLQDPTLELHNRDGDKIAANDNWKIDDQTQQSQQSAIQATGLAPSDDRESAILITLTPGNYTAILAGKNNTSGVGLVEIYNVH